MLGRAGVARRVLEGQQRLVSERAQPGSLLARLEELARLPEDVPPILLRIPPSRPTGVASSPDA